MAPANRTESGGTGGAIERLPRIADFPAAVLRTAYRRGWSPGARLSSSEIVCS